MLLIAVTLNLTVIGHADDATEWNQIMIDALHVGGLPAGGPIRVAPSSLIRHHTQRRRALMVGVSGRSTWGTPASGEHQITSRAFDVDGNIQPAPNDPFLASRRTFWEANGQITRRVLIPS